MPPDRAPSPFARRDRAHMQDLPAPEPAFARTIEARPMEVRAVLRAAVARFARRIGEEDAGALELALAEVLNNVVEHGYGGRPAGLVRVIIGRGPGGLNCRIEDAGSPVPEDLLVSPENEEYPFLDGDPIPEGGFGWKLIHSLVTDIRYRSEGGYNRISFLIPVARVDAALPQSCRNESQSKPERTLKKGP